MPDDDKPNPLDDVRKGLGLLFRAARTTLEHLPTGKLEDVVLTGAKEVGRAIENVAHSVEQQVFGKPPSPPSGASDDKKPADDPKDDAPKP